MGKNVKIVNNPNFFSQKLKIFLKDNLFIIREIPMPGENDSLDENVNIGSKDDLLLEISDEVKPTIENKGELIEPKKENLSRQAKKKAARFEKLKQKRQESRKFKKDLAKERR